MSTQTKAQRLNKEWRTTITVRRQFDLGMEMAAELLRLEAANAELLEALKNMVAHYGMRSLDEARAAIEKHGSKA